MSILAQVKILQFHMRWKFPTAVNWRAGEEPVVQGPGKVVTGGVGVSVR